MTALFRGGEMEAFTASGPGVAETTTGTMYNTTFARCSIQAIGSVGTPDGVYAESMSWSAQTGPLFVHFEEGTDQPATATHKVIGLFSGSTENFRIRQAYSAGDRTWTLQYLNAGAVYTNVGSSVFLTATRADYDLYVNITTGEVTLYVRGSASAATATGLSLGHMSGVTKARCYSDVLGRHWSQVMADTVSTIGKRMMTRPPTGVGANTAWTNSYTEVDETVLTDGDLIYSGTADQVETYAITAPTLTSYTVQDITVSTRANRGAGGPQKMRHALRSAGTDYFSGSDITLGVGYAPVQTTWATDPATSAAWLNAAASAVQPGVKSIA